MSTCSSIGVIFCSESIVCVLFDEFPLLSEGVTEVARALRARMRRSVHFLVMSLEICKKNSKNPLNNSKTTQNQ